LAFIISRQFVGDLNPITIVVSVGSSAVLLFGVPHGSLSQPWVLLGAHTIRNCRRFVRAANLKSIIKCIYRRRCYGYYNVLCAMRGAFIHQAVQPHQGLLLAGLLFMNLGFSLLLLRFCYNVVLMLIIAVSLNAQFAW